MHRQYTINIKQDAIITITSNLVSLKFIASQARSIHQYKNLKGKVLKHCADIFFNRQQNIT